MTSLIERAKQFKVGLISKKELQRYIDFENMGSDTRYYTFEYLMSLLK